MYPAIVRAPALTQGLASDGAFGLPLSVDSYETSSELILELLNIGIDHQPNQLVERNRRLPAKYAFCLRRVAPKMIHF